jgi:hypothetical protein
MQSKTLRGDAIGDVDIYGRRVRTTTVRGPAIGDVDGYGHGIHTTNPVISDVDIYGHRNHTTTRGRAAAYVKDASRPLSTLSESTAVDEIIMIGK